MPFFVALKVLVLVNTNFLFVTILFSGIYYERDCSSEDLDHGVLVVGYGYEGEDVDGKKFWIVKNRYELTSLWSNTLGCLGCYLF